MEDTSTRRHDRRRRHKSDRHRPSATVSTTTGESDWEVDEDGDPEAWATLDRGFRQVQSVLDRNRALIQQVNENQQSRIPGNMVENVSLIHELNGNIKKVVNLYSDINSNFSDACAHHRGGGGGGASKNNPPTRHH